MIQSHFKGLGNQPETKYKRARTQLSIQHFYRVGSSETTREYLSKYLIFKGKDIVRALMKISEKAHASFNRRFWKFPITFNGRRS